MHFLDSLDVVSIIIVHTTFSAADVKKNLYDTRLSATFNRDPTLTVNIL